MSLEQARLLVDERPALHRSMDGRPQIGGLNRLMAEQFIDAIGPLERPTIVESGSGLSTLLFCCLDPAEVISVSPAPELHERIREEAASRGIDTDSLRLVDDHSERALPLLALVEDKRIDVGFIDGSHGWPAVFTDFCYLGKMLRPDGLLFIDDVQTYPVAELVNLLKQQAPHYEVVTLGRKMATFRKGPDIDWLPDWTMEPYLTMNTPTHSGENPIHRWFEVHGDAEG